MTDKTKEENDSNDNKSMLEEMSEALDSLLDD